MYMCISPWFRVNQLTCSQIMWQEVLWVRWQEVGCRTCGLHNAQYQTVVLGWLMLSDNMGVIVCQWASCLLINGVPFAFDHVRDLAYEWCCRCTFCKRIMVNIIYTLHANKSVTRAWLHGLKRLPWGFKTLNTSHNLYFRWTRSKYRAGLIGNNFVY